jgi:hypothetical protein
MIMDARNQKLFHFKYPISEFWADKDKFIIKIGRNIFAQNKIHIDIEDKNNTIQADLTFEHIIPWPVTLLSPGVMGWYRFIPFMECYHAVLSFNHSVMGNIKINGINSDLNNGRGYMEKDWGSSMPSSWIWMQTNHFDEDDVSLFGSIAKIPWLHNYFTGYIFAILYKGQLYRFTTYNGAKIVELQINDEKVSVTLEDKKYKISIDADRANGVDLPAPKMGEMISKVNESLQSNINLILSNKTTGKIIFSGTGRNAGLEIVGNVDELLKGIKK